MTEIRELTVDKELFTNGVVSQVRFFPNDSNRILYSVRESDDNGLYSYRLTPKNDTSDGFEPAGRICFEHDVNDFVFVRDGTVVAAALASGIVAEFKVKGSSLGPDYDLIQVAGETEEVLCIATMLPMPNFLNQERLMICGTSGGSLAIYRPAHNNEVQIIASHLTSVNCLEVRSKTHFLSGHASGQIVSWDASTLWELCSLETDVDLPLTSLAVAPICEGVTSMHACPGNPNVIAFGTNSGNVGIIDIKKSQYPSVVVSSYAITAIRFHPTSIHDMFIVVKDGILHANISEFHRLINENVKPKRNVVNADNVVDADYDVAERENPWLGRGFSQSQLTRITEFSPSFPCVVDLSDDTLIYGTTTQKIAVIEEIILRTRTEASPPLRKASNVYLYSDEMSEA